MYAQTNLQLYHQLREEGRPEGEIARIRRAYELALELLGRVNTLPHKPMVTHGVGTASVLARIGSPTFLVAAGLLHNVYQRGDFGDGDGRGATARRRSRVRRELGEEAEACVFHFSDFTRLIRPGRLEKVVDRSAGITPEQHGALTLHLADMVDKLHDECCVYARTSYLRTVVRGRSTLLELCGRLGLERLGAEFERGFAAHLARRNGARERFLPAEGARTNIQLFDQLESEGYPTARLTLLGRAYDLAADWFLGSVQTDGDLLLSHLIGGASALVARRAPVEDIAAALLHVAGDDRRDEIREALGDGVADALLALPGCGLPGCGSELGLQRPQRVQ